MPKEFTMQILGWLVLGLGAQPKTLGTQPLDLRNDVDFAFGSL